MAFAYPTAVDAEAALAEAWTAVNGATVPVSKLTFDAYVVEGFGLSLSLPMAAVTVPPVADASAALKGMLAPHFGGNKPRALGDGTILKTLLGDLPAILAALQAIISAFGGVSPIAGT